MSAPNTTPTPSYQLTMKMAHHYFKMIQCAHHSNILTEAQSNHYIPPGLAQIEQTVKHLIKPAIPDDTILLDIEEATHDWMLTIISSLTQHYNNTHIELAEYFLIPPDPTFSSFYPNSFDLATQWAESRYGNRLTANILSNTEDHIKAQIQYGNTSDISLLTEESYSDIQMNTVIHTTHSPPLDSTQHNKNTLTSVHPLPTTIPPPENTPHTNTPPLPSTGDLQVCSSPLQKHMGEMGKNVMKGHAKGISPITAQSEPSLKTTSEMEINLDTLGGLNSSTTQHSHKTSDKSDISHTQQPTPSHTVTFHIIDKPIQPSYTQSLAPAKVNKTTHFSPHSHNIHNHQRLTAKHKSLK